MLRFDTFPVGPISANCTLVWDPQSGTGVVVDPGDEPERIRHRVEKAGFQVSAILLTHAHFDHLGAAKPLQDLWKCPVHLHSADRYLVENLDMQTGMFGMKPIPPPLTVDLHPGESHLGLQVLHTPGHTPGSCCFRGEFELGPLVITGDTLFKGGVGRTDLWGGRWDELETSIRRELYVLDDCTQVLPGHGPATTIRDEAAGNPFVKR